MKKYALLIAVISSFILNNCNAGNPSKKETSIVHLTNEKFKTLVFNYEQNKEWKYEGNLPCIVDFYADWCGPCRKMSPILEEMATKYKGKIIIYKINTDQEKFLSQNMGIQNLPTLLFCPAKGKPQVSVGLLSKEELQKAIHEILLTL